MRFCAQNVGQERKTIVELENGSMLYREKGAVGQHIDRSSGKHSTREK